MQRLKRWLQSAPRWLWRKLPAMASLVLLGIAVIMKIEQYPFIIQLQYQVFDTYQQQFPREYEPAGVKVIDIDDESLTRLGQWPWPRQVVAELVYRLITHNAAVIGFDIVFAERDRTSPTSIAELWHTESELTKLLFELPDHDQMLADAFKQGYIVTGYILNNQDTPRMPVKNYGMSYAGLPGSHPLDHMAANYSGAILNLPILEDAAEGNGFFNNIPDQDGIIRRVPLALAADDEIYFSLAMEALRVAQGARSYIIKMAGASGEESYGVDSGITQIRNGGLTIPTDKNGRLLMHYTPFTKDRYIPAWKVLSDDFDGSQLEGTILLIGTSAPGLLDLRATPLNPSLPGVEVHAQALEQILLDTYLYRADWMLSAEIIMMVIGGIVLMIIMARLTAVWGAIFMVFAQAISFGSSAYAYTQYGYLIDPVSPSIVILLLYLSESLRRYILSESERKQVRGAFAQYMSPALVEELAKNPDRLRLGGEMKEMTILFADIRGFTAISEQFDAQGLTEFINRFLTPMTDVILKRQGTIDKYMGDCIMAFWNAPLDDKQHALHGCLSALEMFEVERQLNEERQKQAEAEGIDFLPVRIGIGLNTGEVCVGNMGSDQRFDYSVLGDDVNLASRLEGQSKTYGVGIVIGEKTQAEIPQLATLELDLIQVKGKSTAVRIYALLGDEAFADRDDFGKLKRLWQQVLDAYRHQQWDDAENFIGLCVTTCQSMPEIDLSGLFELYRERIRAFRLNPPPDNWDGVFRATSK